MENGPASKILIGALTYSLGLHIVGPWWVSATVEA